MEQAVVCLDPGHGPDTVNGSPDGAYKEREFVWDMYLRLQRLLEEQGIRVVGTRKEWEKPSLTRRAQISNESGADLFVSLHSNAAGSGWSEPRGLMIYTSAPGAEAPRNIAARDILNSLRAAGITIWGSGLAYESFTVLVETTAPAVLIEFGFHTNREEVLELLDPAYREKLALATARGICNFLGVVWEEPNEPATWAKEAWEKAVALGIMDGTAPQGTVTREMLAVVLDRCGLLEEKPAGRQTAGARPIRIKICRRYRRR